MTKYDHDHDDDISNTELTTPTRNDNYVARHTDGEDPYTKFATECGPGIQGTLLTCKNGVWSIGRENKPVKGEPPFLAILPSVLRGWLKWRDGRIVASDVGYVRDGFVMKRQYELDDQDDDTQWERDDEGKPKNPWNLCLRLLLVELSPPHGDFTFAGTSWGAYFALQDLCGHYKERPSPDAQPVVTLTTRSRPNKKKGGFITGPWFDIAGWATIDEVRAGHKAGAAKVAKSKAARSKAVDLEQPAAWGSNKSDKF